MARLVQDEGLCPCMTENTIKSPSAQKMDGHLTPHGTPQPVAQDKGGGFRPGPFRDLGFDRERRTLGYLCLHVPEQCIPSHAPKRRGGLPAGQFTPFPRQNRLNGPKLI